MSTPAKPQNVCRGCRSRKKRCDGSRPSCSSCSTRGELCYYEKSNRHNVRHGQVLGHAYGNAPRSSAPQVWNSWPMDEIDALLGLETNEIVPPLEDSFGWMLSNNEPLATGVNSSGFEEPSLAVAQITELPTPPASDPKLPELPELPDILQLVDLFFEKFHRYLPILHKHTIVSAIKSHGVDGIPPVLLYAIIAVSAGAHPNRRFRQSQEIWYEEAKSRVSKEMRLPDHVLQTLQAGVLVVYLGLALVDYATSIVMLGEAWRKTIAIAYGNNLRNMIVKTLGTQEKASWIEKEELVRISWVLFIMDRGMCFPIGLIHAIDDRRMKIELPMSEHDFQTTEGPPSHCSNLFTYNMDNLIAMLRDRGSKGSATQLQYLILGYALLGRISEALDAPDDCAVARKEQIESLCAQLAKVRLMLPRSATELSMANYDEFIEVIWLNVVLNACTILLHHRPLQEGESLDDPGTEMAKNWPLCVAAARNTVSVLRDASRVSVEFVSNAHYPCLLFTSCRIILTEYFCPSTYSKATKTADGVGLPRPRDPKLREDLEVVTMAFYRMKEEWQSLGQKFSKGMYFFLHQGEEFARKTKAGGARSLLGVCDSWLAIPDDYELTIPN
ncbi:fungal-specific transcription factor domain-containing protein [Trichoderma chlorosporum]